jgi:hypothetical protein
MQNNGSFMTAKRKLWSRRTRGFIISLVVLVSMVLWYGWTEFNRRSKSIVITKADYELSESAFIQEFETDSQRADKKYNDKVVQVKGVVKEIGKSKDTYIIGLGSSLSLSSVQCFLDSLQIIPLPPKKEGSFVTIKGRYVGFNRDDLLGSDIVLNRCVLVNDHK